MLSREDRLLSELLVSRGLVARDAIATCVKMRESVHPTRSLVDALIDSGDLDPRDAEGAAEEARSLDKALELELPAVGRLGEFRLIREIGRGGMGIVYEAEQESLGRRVALKILPAGAALDERLAIRFLREARAAGSLHHPGIVPVFTSGRAEGVLFFAMELIDGISLADAASHGPMTPGEAARIAAAVARALGHAHLSGFVHRDIKPENILLGKDGAPRITDFGLVHELSGASFTLAHNVLGTPAYIAPEQALGEPVDPKCDVYSLGAVLYTLLCGHSPYPGDLPSAVLGRVLAGAPPPLAAERPELPPDLVAICERAMDRRVDERYSSALGMAHDLERFLRGEPVLANDMATQVGDSLVRGEPTPAGASPRRLRRGAWALVIAGAATLASVVLLALPRPAGGGLPFAQPPRRATFTRLVRGAGQVAFPSWSPDGRSIAYVSNATGTWGLFLETPGSGEPVNLTSGSAAAGATTPAFSPDGRSIAYRAGAELMGIAVLDLASRRVRRLTNFGFSPTWSPDGREIVFADAAPALLGRARVSKLYAVSVASGLVRGLTGIDASLPSYSPHGRRVAFVSQGGDQTDIWTIAANGGEAVRVTNDAALDWSPIWSADGSQLYFGSDRGKSCGLWRVRVDEVTGRPVGAAEAVSDTRFASPFYLAVSPRGGRMALVSIAAGGRLHRIALDPERTVTGAPEALQHQVPDASFPDISPDGRLLVFSAAVRAANLAVVPSDGASAARLLTNDTFLDLGPRWSPDGMRIAFSSDRDGGAGIWTMRADGGDLKQITVPGLEGATYPVWSPDGSQLACSVAGGGAGIVTLGDGATPAVAEMMPQVTPSGVPFEPWSWSPGGDEIAGTAGGIVVFSLRDRRYRQITDVGARPTWLPDGKRLIFATDRKLFLLDIRTPQPKILYDAAPNQISDAVTVTKDGRTVYVALAPSPEEVWEVGLKE